jgi:hypothetical protein
MPCVIRRLAHGLVLLALTAAGCGGGKDGGIGTAPGPALAAGFAVHNGSAREAWYVYTRECGTHEWGEDELGSANVLIPGETAGWAEYTGCYDLLALTARGGEPRYQARFDGNSVAGAQATRVTITDDDWTEVTDPDVAALASRRT